MKEVYKQYFKEVKALEDRSVEGQKVKKAMQLPCTPCYFLFSLASIQDRLVVLHVHNVQRNIA